MLRIIVREILIFVGCLVLLPIAVLMVFSYTHSLEEGVRFLERGMFNFPLAGRSGIIVFVLLKLAVPYFVVQAARAHFWAQTGIVARKWANLYFSLLLFAIGGWSFWKAWDLLYFMYALGDLPEEIPQFLELQGTSVVVFLIAFILAFHCFRIFLNPEGNRVRGSREL